MSRLPSAHCRWPRRPALDRIARLRGPFRRNQKIARPLRNAGAVAPSGDPFLFDQHRGLAPERGRDSIDGLEAGEVQSPLEPRDRGLRGAKFIGQLGLRQPGLQAQETSTAPPLHGRRIRTGDHAPSCAAHYMAPVTISWNATAREAWTSARRPRRAAIPTQHLTHRPVTELRQHLLIQLARPSSPARTTPTEDDPQERQACPENEWSRRF